MKQWKRKKSKKEWRRDLQRIGSS